MKRFVPSLLDDRAWHNSRLSHCMNANSAEMYLVWLVILDMENVPLNL